MMRFYTKMNKKFVVCVSQEIWHCGIMSCYNLDNGQTELIMNQSDGEFINGLSLNY